MDLVLVTDATGSMCKCIAEAAKALQDVAAVLSQLMTTLQVGVVAYRDHLDKETIDAMPLTGDIGAVRKKLQSIKAYGGGDHPEAMALGLKEANGLFANGSGAMKVLVLVADAPPHGFGAAHDSYPQGDPSGCDPLREMCALKEAGVMIYTVGANIQDDVITKDLFIHMAETTGGKAVALNDTCGDQLGLLISGAGKEVIGLTELSQAANPDAVQQIVDQRIRDEQKALEEEIDSLALDDEDAYNEAREAACLRSRTQLEKGIHDDVASMFRSLSDAAPQPQMQVPDSMVLRSATASRMKEFMSAADARRFYGTIIPSAGETDCSIYRSACFPRSVAWDELRPAADCESVDAYHDATGECYRSLGAPLDTDAFTPSSSTACKLCTELAPISEPQVSLLARMVTKRLSLPARLDDPRS